MKKSYHFIFRLSLLVMSCITLLVSGLRAQSSEQRLYEFLKRKENRTITTTELQEININPDSEVVLAANAIGPAGPDVTVGFLRSTLDGVVQGIGKQIREQANLSSQPICVLNWKL